MEEKKSFYLETTTGNLFLVEIRRTPGKIILTIGDRRFDLSVESAYELADLLLTT